MGTLTNSIFQALLGWIRSLSSEVWITLSSPDRTTFLRWIGTYWKEITVGLCLVGMILDFVVYIFRWQPYRVWFRIFHRNGRKRGSGIVEYDRKNTKSADDAFDSVTIKAQADKDFSRNQRRQRMGYFSDQPADHDLVPDGKSIDSGTLFEEDHSEREMIQEVLWSDQPDNKRSLNSAQANNLRKPNYTGYSDQSGSSDAETGNVWRRNEPEGTTDAFDQALRYRRRRSVSRFLSDEQRDTVAPEQLIDQYAAYRRPVYPRNWKTENKQNEEIE